MKELLKNLVRSKPTIENGELRAAEVLADYFTVAGIDSEVDQWADSHSVRANIISTVKGSGEKPGLMFVSHLDVVPADEAKWKSSPFEPIEVDGKMFGRGVTDMKGGTVAAAAAIVELAQNGVEFRGDIIFAATAGEETDSCGVKRFLEKMKIKGVPELAGMIVPEPTNFEVVTAHRGALWLKITTHGKTAHGSMPHLGINAIVAMKSVLDRLTNYKVPCTEHRLFGRTSMSINEIAGGSATNVIPDSCSIGIDIRTLPGQKHQDVISGFEEILGELAEKNSDFKADVSVTRSLEAVQADNDSEFVQQFGKSTGINETRAVGYTTDASFLAELEKPFAIFGPGRSDVCHKSDEYIEIADLEKAKEYYKKIIADFLT